MPVGDHSDALDNPPVKKAMRGKLTVWNGN